SAQDDLGREQHREEEDVQTQVRAEEDDDEERGARGGRERVIDRDLGDANRDDERQGNKDADRDREASKGRALRRFGDIHTDLLDPYHPVQQTELDEVPAL